MQDEQILKYVVPFKLDALDLARTNELSRKLGRSKSELVRTAWKEFLDRHLSVAS